MSAGTPVSASSSLGGEGERRRHMSELDDLEFDPYELAEELGHTDELGRHDMSDPNIERATTKASRMSRRDLVVKGGLGAATLAGLGSVTGRASAATERA